jgi:RNA polymerase subunit RPABC4/transcription elongation factor Spt4
MAKKLIGYGNFFCWNCGERIEKGKRICPNCGSKYSGDSKYGNVSALGAGGIGWSHNAAHHSFKKYFKNDRKYSMIWLIGISILVPGGMLLSREIELDTEGIMVIGGILAAFWGIGLLFMFKKRGKKPDWDGIVEDKKTFQKTRLRKDREGKKYEESYTEYIVYIRKQNNSIFELKEEDSAQYDYFNIYDYLHYHGDKYLNYIEKYDKSLDTIIFCASCRSICDIRDNYCERCGCILLKADWLSR